MNLKLSCADFSFPLLPHEAALQLISQLGLRGVDIGLFAGRSHLRPETELRAPAKNGEKLRRRLADHGLATADVFLQVHEHFTEFAINHPEPLRRTFAISIPCDLSRRRMYEICTGHTLDNHSARLSFLKACLKSSFDTIERLIRSRNIST